MKNKNDISIIDLRSDTVTKPNSKMWAKLKNLDNSDLGDDVEQEDPLVNTLEKRAAALVDKEAALFVTSGTQGNLISLLAHTDPGDEILLEEHSHIYKWEVGGAARIGGLMVRTFPSNKGIFQPQDLEALIRDASDIHQPRTALISLENTHNYYGGVVLPPSLFHKTRKFADSYQLKFHVDGARIFNAFIANTGKITDYTQYVDSIQFCLSKGLCCPVGSIIAGSDEFISKARKIRKMLGGGWRQAGVLAVFGLEALKSSWIQRLREDHRLAKYLAKKLEQTSENLRTNVPDTNIVMVNIPKTIDLDRFEHLMAQKGVLAHRMGPRIRLVTHYGLNQADIDRASEIIINLVKKLS